jgi:hypothetical protein
MAIRIVKNSSTETKIIVDMGIAVPPSGQVDLAATCSLEQIASSRYLLYLLGSYQLTLNDGTSDLEWDRAIDMIRGYDKPIPLMGDKNKIRTYSSCRPIGTKICFTGIGDTLANNYTVGGGQELYHEHLIGDSTVAYIYIDFNTIENLTYLYEGYATWQNCDGDSMSFNVVPKVTIVTAGTNTMYNVYGGYLVIPAAGNGTAAINDADRRLVPVVPSIDTGLITTPGYWNATWNTTTKQFENITAAPSGNGEYNMYSYEITGSIFCNRLPMFGTTTGWSLMDTSDAERFPHNMRVKVTFRTRLPDHSWKWGGIITLYRAKTC